MDCNALRVVIEFDGGLHDPVEAARIMELDLYAALCNTYHDDASIKSMPDSRSWGWVTRSIRSITVTPVPVKPPKKEQHAPCEEDA